MSQIRKFRLNGFDTSKSPELYISVEDSRGRAMCKLAFDNDGLWYYKGKSRILTPGENRKTRNTPNSFISMVDLMELFEALTRAGWSGTFDQSRKLRISRVRKEVTIKPD